MGSTDKECKILEIGIVGAGIAGLGAAIALRKAGHNVILYEKSTFKREIGAAITLTPNANLILDKWNFDAKAVGETQKLQSRRLDLYTLEQTLPPLDLSDVPAHFDGHEFNAFHRVDLHEGLRAMAMEHGVELQLGREAVDLSCDQGILVFKDGSQVQKDLLIVADGIRVRIDDGYLWPTGKSVFRTLIPISRLESDSQIWPNVWENETSGFMTFNGTKTMFVTYPCSADTIMNCAIFHDTAPHLENNDDWNSPASVEDVLSEVKDAHPIVRSIVQHADPNGWKCYTVGFREDAIPRTVKGRVALIGDAAHPMQPTHAQGGCVSLEDGAALGELFANWSETDNVESRLKLFNQLRLPRNNTTQILSNSMFYAKLTDLDTETLIRKYYQGPILKSSAPSWSPPMQDYFYSYDVFREAAKALEYKDVQGGIPEGVIQHFGRYDGKDRD